MSIRTFCATLALLLAACGGGSGDTPALVLYATITGQSPSDLPPMPQYPVELSLQETLRGIAAETVQTIPPRMWCPGDAI